MLQDKFPILSIETSSKLCSAALILSPDDYFEITISQKHVHSKKLLSIIDNLLKQNDIKITDVKMIAVSIGPGSFTGLRIGLSSAKGLAYGTQLPIVPVPTFDAMAFQINSICKKNKFAIANKVNTDELYFAKYNFDENFNPVKTENLKIIYKNQLDELTNDFIVYGDAVSNQFSSPNAWAVGKYAYLFGKDLLTSDYDLLEPMYLKEFKIKVKK